MKIPFTAFEVDVAEGTFLSLFYYDCKNSSQFFAQVLISMTISVNTKAPGHATYLSST